MVNSCNEIYGVYRRINAKILIVVNVKDENYFINIYLNYFVEYYSKNFIFVFSTFLIEELFYKIRVLIYN